MQITKYELSFDPEQTLEVAVDCEILSVSSCEGGIVLWAAIDPDAPLTEQTFRVVTKELDMPDYHECMYIGTVIVRYTLAEIPCHVFVKAEEIEC